MSAAGRLMERARYTDVVYEAGSVCRVVDGAERAEILRAMQAEQVSNAYTDSFYAVIRKRVDDGELAVIKIEGRWRLIDAAKVGVFP